MTLYISNDLLYGPRFEVSLLPQFLVGVGWRVYRKAAGLNVRYLALHLGPLVAIYTWPNPETP